MRVLLFALFVIFCTSAIAAGGIDDMLQKPEGFYGEGHEEHHPYYDQLPPAPDGMHCCSEKDCRPTQARWFAGPWEGMIVQTFYSLPEGHWEAMIDGEWYPIEPGAVMDSAHLQQQGRPRWDEQAHICTPEPFVSDDGTRNNKGAVYCFIPPESGQ